MLGFYGTGPNVRYDALCNDALCNGLHWFYGTGPIAQRTNALCNGAVQWRCAF